MSTTSDRACGSGFEALHRAIDEVLGATKRPAHLHEPIFRGREWDYVKDTIDIGWVSSVGAYVDRFEQELARVCGVARAVVTVNGTAALHMCLRLVGVGQDDEVLVPALTFIATANAVAYCGAVPHFCDVNEASLGIDPAKLDAHLTHIAERSDGGCRNRETGRRIAAVMPMHTFGHPVEIDELLEVCQRWGLPFVEDAAEALGSVYKGRHVGGFGRVAGLSFNGNKIVTTGGGGAILTNDEPLGKRAKHLTTTAKLPHRWAFNHDEIGFNYRLPNLNAALGCAQLEMLPEFVAKKRTLAGRYRRAFATLNGARIFEDAPYAASNYWLVTMILADADESRRDSFIEECHERGVVARPIWTGLHRQPMFTSCPRMNLDVTESLERRIVNLPSSTFIEDQRIARTGDVARDLQPAGVS